MCIRLVGVGVCVRVLSFCFKVRTQRAGCFSSSFLNNPPGIFVWKEEVVLQQHPHLQKVGFLVGIPRAGRSRPAGPCYRRDKSRLKLSHCELGFIGERESRAGVTRSGKCAAMAREFPVLRLLPALTLVLQLRSSLIKI